MEKVTLPDFERVGAWNLGYADAGEWLSTQGSTFLVAYRAAVSAFCAINQDRPCLHQRRRAFAEGWLTGVDHWIAGLSIATAGSERA
jgi:hypothetical protein